jgi:hypothetical protein
MVVRASQLDVHGLPAVAVPGHHGPSLWAGLPSVAPLHQLRRYSVSNSRSAHPESSHPSLLLVRRF